MGSSEFRFCAGNQIIIGPNFFASFVFVVVVGGHWLFEVAVGTEVWRIVVVVRCEKGVGARGNRMFAGMLTSCEELGCCLLGFADCLAWRSEAGAYILC